MNDTFTWGQPTPWGTLQISAGDSGVAGVRLRGRRDAGRLEASAPRPIRDIAVAFESFFDGNTDALGPVPVDFDQIEADFQRTVLETLRRVVGPGDTISYGELAEVAGHPGAARAVGTAMARNPFPIVVPCHRVLASNGGIGGYGGGLEMKRGLLSLEGTEGG